MYIVCQGLSFQAFTDRFYCDLYPHPVHLWSYMKGSSGGSGHPSFQWLSAPTTLATLPLSNNFGDGADKVATMQCGHGDGATLWPALGRATVHLDAAPKANESSGSATALVLWTEYTHCTGSPTLSTGPPTSLSGRTEAGVMMSAL